MYTTGRFIIDGKEVTPPIEAVPKVGENGVFIEASFGENNVQPSITPLEFTFANQGAKEIRDFIANGDIFKNMDFEAEVIGDAGTVEAINGYLDLTENFKDISPVQVRTSAKFKESTLTLEEQVSSITLDMLIFEGALTSSDYTQIPYLVEKPINAVEIAAITITLFLMVKELAETVEKISQDTATVLGLTSTAVTGGIGATVYQIAIIVVRTAYASVLLNAIINLMTDLLNQFISPVRNQPSLKYRTILEKGFAYLGYGFESNIPELDTFHYFPSLRGKPSEAGIPSAQDYGYIFGEMVLLMRTQFKANIAVVDNVIQFRNEDDPYWLKNSTYQMPDVLLDDENPKRYNTDELVKSRILRYQLDSSDDWTLNNYLGTQYTVTTEHTDTVDRKKSGLRGFEYIDFNIALGSRKDGLNTLEKTLKVLAKAADTILGALGSNKNFAKKIENRVGMVKVSQEETTRPKCIVLNGGTMPPNHRDVSSAKYLWNNYINVLSFVDNNFKRQRIYYEGVTFGFGLSGFLKTFRNSYFYTESGKVGKFTNIKWDWESDQVIADFWIQEVYTTKLKQNSIERG